MTRLRLLPLLGVLALGLGLVLPSPLAARSAADDAPDFKAVDAAVRRGISRGVYPGAVIVIGQSNKLLHAERYGRLTWDSHSARPRSDSTLWDLASLTKVVAAGAAMRLIDQGLLDLDAPVRTYVSEFSGGMRDQVTVRMLLNHTSGLRPYIPFWRTATSRDEALTQLFADPLRRPPGTAAEYSDLNAILMGLVLERASGTSLDSLLRREVLDPLAMHQTWFRPEASLWERVAPSFKENDLPVFGVPSDQNAVLLGGISGHAGLFATGRDLARYAQAWLRGGLTSDGETWVQSATVEEFLTGSPNAGTRLLGWDTPDPEYEPPSVFGRLLSPLAYGHTGWSGTEMWIDPARDLFVVFLTNRSFDPRARNSFRALRDIRAAVSDAAARAVPVIRG